MDAALAELASLFPGPFLHIGGDEPYGMPDQAYGDYVRHLKHAVRALGKRSVGWQESIRAGAVPAMSSSTGWTRAASGPVPNSRPGPRSRPGSARTTGAAAPSMSRLWPTACR